MIDWLKNVAVWDMAGWVTALAAAIALVFGVVQVLAAKASSGRLQQKKSG